VLIESSTLTVPWVRELAAAATERGCDFLDAPVTGSRDQAAAGQLKFLVGGEAATLSKARAVLAAMSRSIVHLGPSGSGALVKLINNGVCGVQSAALAEGLALIEKSGLDPSVALPVLTDGAPGSPLVKAVSARMMARDYVPHFTLRLMAKDLTYARGEGERHQRPWTTVAAALGVFQGGVDAGDGERDFSAVVEQFRSG
jgi:3-hydroxyisobutyrate dehydrogenase